MIRAALMLTALACSSCTNIAWELQQPNPAVKPILVGRDCVDTYFGLGSGTATFSNAMRRGIPIDVSQEWTGYTPIRTIHSASITASAFWIFGTYCLRLAGEP